MIVLRWAAIIALTFCFVAFFNGTREWALAIFAMVCFLIICATTPLHLFGTPEEDAQCAATDADIEHDERMAAAAAHDAARDARTRRLSA